MNLQLIVYDLETTDTASPIIAIEKSQLNFGYKRIEMA